MKTIDYAMKYLDFGFSVIPIYSNKLIENDPYFLEEFKSVLATSIDKERKKGATIDTAFKNGIATKLLINYSKRSLVQWKKYSEERPTTAEVEGWFRDWPLANIGIITGKISNIFVLDVDGKIGEEYINECGGTPKTPTVQTGKGRHLYFKYPKGMEIKSSTCTNLKLDIRADGGYVVAPPSIHGSKREYQWQKGYSLLDLEISEASDWIIDFATKPKKTSNSKDKASVTKPKKSEVTTLTNCEELDANFMDIPDIPDITNNSNQNIVDLIEQGCPEGSRNDSATRVIGHWLKVGLPAEEVWSLLKMWNLKNQPPMEEDELSNIFNSILSSEAESIKSDKINLSDFQVSMADIVKDFGTDVCNRFEFGGKDLTHLQKQLSGGFVGGNLYLLGGIPSSGKTALCNNIADNLCLNDFPVIIFSFDDGDRELHFRTISRFTSINIEDLNQNKLDEGRIKIIHENDQLKKIYQFKIIISKSIVVEKWQELIDDIAEKFEKKPVIFIDYLKKVRSKYSPKEERLRMDANISAITTLAKDNDIPIIAISELNRESYKGGNILTMSAFKETGALEYEASWLAILAPVEENDDGQLMVLNSRSQAATNGPVSLVVLKTKRGTGKKGKIPLSLDVKKMNFSSDFNLRSEADAATIEKMFA